MKKVIIGIAIACVIAIAVVGVIFIKKEKDKEQEELNKYVTLLDYEDFVKKIENKDDFILIITGSQCSHCEAYLPVFKKVLKDYDLHAYEVEQDTWELKEQGYLKSIATASGTPTVVIIKNGEEENTLNRIVGERSRSYTIDKFKAFGIIK